MTMRKLRAAARKLNARVETYLGATDVILPEGVHFRATGTQLVSGQPDSLLQDLAEGIEPCRADCEHWFIEPDELTAIADVFAKSRPV